MVEPVLPGDLIEARKTPLFDAQSVPAALTKSHRTNVWAVLHVEEGCVRFLDLEGERARDVSVEAGGQVVIMPEVDHRIEPSSTATFFVQFYRQSEARIACSHVQQAAEKALKASLVQRERGAT